MIVLHAIWTEGRLHLWAERGCGNGDEGSGSTRRADGLPVESPAFALTADELRRRVGDLWDSLLILGAFDSELSLLLPSRDGRFLPSCPGPTPEAEADDREGIALVAFGVPALAFSAEDAVDLLTGLPTFGQPDVVDGASLRFWARAAELVLELLARQRYVPAIKRMGPDQYRGFWRAIVDDEETSVRLGALIASMPPLCRATVKSGGTVQASDLVENFLWMAVDSLVRRCLEGDQLAHALHDRSGEVNSEQIRWLRSLVHSDPTVRTTPEQCAVLCGNVETWLSRLEPLSQERTWKTCFRLHPPERRQDTPDGRLSESAGSLRSWRLSIHVQATEDTERIVDASSVLSEASDDPAILKRPFVDAPEYLREDLAHAARHFPPLASCAESGGPLECSLTLEEAYRFLCDVAPVLTLEGFGVLVPRWWRTDRPRLRLHLDIHPLAHQTEAEVPTVRLDSLVAYDWSVALGDDALSPEEISELAAVKAPLVQLRGQWTEVQPSDVEAALKFIQRQRGGTMTVFEALRRSYMVDNFEAGLPIAGLRAHGWINKLLNATEMHDAIEHVDPPRGFQGTLRSYQIKGIEWLWFLARHGLGSCLADDMGLGKTIQLIALWLHERQVGDPPGPTLLVVPMSLVGNWSREIARFAPSLKVMVHHGLERLTGQEFVSEVTAYDVVISTYGLAHRDFEHLGAVPWHRIALDEAQNIKNPAAKQSMAVRSLQSVHRVALTGTPIENRLSELWSIMDFLNPSYLGGAREFRRRFAIPVERYHDQDRAEQLRHLLRPFVLRRRKEDPGILDELPEKMEMRIFCNLTKEQAALYEAIVGDMLGQIGQAGGIQRRGLILATLTRLKQVCNHPAHFLGDGSSLPHRSGKCDRIAEMLEEVVAEGHAALVFTQYREMGLLLQRMLQESLDREILFLHGGSSRKNRDRMVERFQDADGRTPVFLLSLKAGGFGLNLTAANHVFHFDRWWNPAVEDQATDRAHRIGQTKQVQVHKFVCIGTLEERIDDMIEHKRVLAESIVGGGGEDWITELSTDALRDFLKLSREAVAED